MALVIRRWLLSISPERRVQCATWLFVVSIVGWIVCHIAMVLTNSGDWVFHVLLGLSWLAVTFTALDIIFTTDVRRQVEEED